MHCTHYVLQYTHNNSFRYKHVIRGLHDWIRLLIRPYTVWSSYDYAPFTELRVQLNAEYMYEHKFKRKSSLLSVCKYIGGSTVICCAFKLTILHSDTIGLHASINIIIFNKGSAPRLGSSHWCSHWIYCSCTRPNWSCQAMSPVVFIHVLFSWDMMSHTEMLAAQNLLISAFKV